MHPATHEPTIHDHIAWLQSLATGRRFPIVVFTADTDMATDGWVSLTSLDGRQIVVTEATSDEYTAVIRRLDGYLDIERRVNRVLGRDDLRCVWLVEDDGARNSPTRKLAWRDILAEGSVAHEVGHATRAAFERDGGRVIVLGRA